MRLESENFVVRTLQKTDKENMRSLEMSRPWVPYILDPDREETSNKPDYFTRLWSEYIKDDYNIWIIERKPNIFCGDVILEIDKCRTGKLYIMLMDDADITGFGKELFGQVLKYISAHLSVSDIYIELWNDKDRSQQVYIEAGYKMKKGYLEISI